MPSGAVALWAGQGVEGVCCFGDLLATAMRVRGVVAAVVDGGVHDIRFLHERGMPVFTRHRTLRKAWAGQRRLPARFPSRSAELSCDWLTISPGDILVGDAYGLIAIPSAMLDQVSAAAANLSLTETGARRDIARGLRLLAALARYGHL